MRLLKQVLLLFDAAVDRARELRGEVIREPWFNPAPKQREIWLGHPDGHVVVIASPDGEPNPSGASVLKWEG